MRISNATARNLGRMAARKKAGDASGTFSGLLGARTAAARNGISAKKMTEDSSRLEYIDIGTKCGLSAHFPYASFPMKISSLMEPVKLNLGRLTDAKRAELNEKYQIDSIKPDSQEYLALIKDLQREGVLSGGNAYALPPNVIGIETDANGRVTAIKMMFLGDSGKDGGILDYTRNLLGFGADNYERLAGKENLTSGERAVVSIYESHQNIMAAIEEIFSSQLKK